MSSVRFQLPFPIAAIRSRAASFLAVGVLSAGTAVADAPSSPKTAKPAGHTVSGQTSRASPPPERTYSKYVQRAIQAALNRSHRQVATESEGKLIEAVDIVRFDIIEEQDPAPSELNWFHATTQHNIVERELLLGVGTRFDRRLADETERNLRQLGLFSVVVSVPVQGSQPDRIRYLVITKDIWSLRAGWDGRYANGVLDLISVRPSEINLLGTGRRISGSLAINPRTIQVGLGAYEPRLGGSRLRLGANFAATINCTTGNIEGYNGSFEYSRPLYSTRARWAYATSVSLSQSTSRLYGALGKWICAADNSVETTQRFRETEDSPIRVAVVPNEYSYDSQSFTQSFTRSFGISTKNNLSIGLNASRTARTAATLDNVRWLDDGSTDDFLQRAASAWYRRRLRPNTRQFSPFVQLISFKNLWHRDIHAETLGLQETFRLGPIASLRVYTAHKSLGSSRSFFGTRAFAAYAARLGSGYVKIQASHNAELASSLADTNADFDIRLRVTSPRLKYGRFVSDQRLHNAYHNFSNSFAVLDNTYRLRGYRAAIGTSDLYGSGYAVSNVEFRSKPLHLFSTLLGGVAFYDVGDAFYENEPLHFRHGAGVGLRFLAPQLDREVLRIDVGFPLNPNDPLGEMTVNATFGQAFASP